MSNIRMAFIAAVVALIALFGSNAPAVFAQPPLPPSPQSVPTNGWGLNVAVAKVDNQGVDLWFRATNNTGEAIEAVAEVEVSGQPNSSPATQIPANDSVYIKFNDWQVQNLPQPGTPITAKFRLCVSGNCTPWEETSVEDERDGDDGSPIGPFWESEGCTCDTRSFEDPDYQIFYPVDGPQIDAFHLDAKQWYSQKFGKKLDFSRFAKPGEPVVFGYRVSWPGHAPVSGTVVLKDCALKEKFGKLTIKKLVNNQSGATLDPSIRFTIDVAGPNNFATSVEFGPEGGEKTLDNLVPGVYNVSERAPGGNWVVSGGGPVTVVADETATSEVTNTLPKTDEKFGKLTIKKLVNNQSGATLDPSIRFTIDVAGPNNFATSVEFGPEGGEKTLDNLVPGVYNVSERAPGGNWVVSGGGPVTVVADETATSEVTNTLNGEDHPKGQLLIKKVVVNNSGKALNPSLKFIIDVTGPDGFAEKLEFGPQGGERRFENLKPGTYHVSERNPGADWLVSGSGIDVVVEANKGAAHTVTNTIGKKRPGHTTVNVSFQARCVSLPYDPACPTNWNPLGTIKWMKLDGVPGAIDWRVQQVMFTTDGEHPNAPGVETHVIKGDTRIIGIDPRSAKGRGLYLPWSVFWTIDLLDEQGNKYDEVTHVRTLPGLDPANEETWKLFDFPLDPNYPQGEQRFYEAGSPEAMAAFKDNFDSCKGKCVRIELSNENPSVGEKITITVRGNNAQLFRLYVNGELFASNTTGIFEYTIPSEGEFTFSADIVDVNGQTHTSLECAKWVKIVVTTTEFEEVCTYLNPDGSKHYERFPKGSPEADAARSREQEACRKRDAVGDTHNGMVTIDTFQLGDSDSMDMVDWQNSNQTYSTNVAARHGWQTKTIVSVHASKYNIAGLKKYRIGNQWYKVVRLNVVGVDSAEYADPASQLGEGETMVTSCRTWRSATDVEDVFQAIGVPITAEEAATIH